MLNFKRNRHVKDLAQILAQFGNREELLGVKEPIIPTPQQIKQDAAKLANYSHSTDYKRFADEVWARTIGHLDKILDDKSSQELIKFHCGALKEDLDLLRLSYQARSVLEQADQEASDTPHR